MDLLWVLSVSMLTACVAIPMDAAAGSHSLFTCEPITLRMCQGLPYNATFMPNILNHYDQQTAALAMEVEYPPTREPPFVHQTGGGPGCVRSFHVCPKII